MTSFERNIDCVASGEGRYRFNFDDAFLGAAGMFGGLTLAACCECATRHVSGPELRLRSVSAVFVNSVKPGPCEAGVHEIRRGRSVIHVGTSLQNTNGEPAVEALAVFGRDRPGFAFLDKTPPDVPPADQSPLFDAPPGGGSNPPLPLWAAQPMWKSIERRVAIGHQYWERDWTSTGSLAGMWLRYDEMPRLKDETVHPLAVLALTDMAGEAISEKVGPDAPEWGMASLDHNAHLLAPTRSKWLLLICRAPHAADGYVSVETEVWDQDGHLVAVGSQKIVVTIFDSQ